MACPHSKELPGLIYIRGCLLRKSYTGIKGREPIYASCDTQCYNGPYTQCPNYREVA